MGTAVRARVPARRIFGASFTGIGAKFEGEVVVLVGNRPIEGEVIRGLSEADLQEADIFALVVGDSDEDADWIKIVAKRRTVAGAKSVAQERAEAAAALVEQKKEA